jgi:CSLREA domain-containing protein
MKSSSVFLNTLVGIWFLLVLLASNVHAQAPSPGPEPYRDGERAPQILLLVNSALDAVDAAPGNGICATAASDCTLRAAVQEANALPGDDIISLPSGTYTLTLAGAGEDVAASGDLDLTGNVALDGAGAATTIIDGGQADRILHILGAQRVHIAGVTLTHGNGSGGGIRNEGAALVIVNSTVFRNNAGLDAGGVLSSGTLTITGSSITENNAGRDAGGILSSGALYIDDSTVHDNNAGGNAGGVLASGPLFIAASTLSTNNARDDAGALLSSGTTVITGSVIMDNNAGNSGGGLFHTGPATVTGSTFAVNSAGTRGGGIFSAGPLAVTGSTFSDNSGGDGGGLLTRAVATVVNSTFSANDAVKGGDIFNDGGGLVVHNSTLFGEVSDPDRSSVASPLASGGGISNDAAGGGSVLLTNTILAGHESGGNCSGAITNGGNNLEDGTTCGWKSDNGSLSATDPRLGTLAGKPAYFPLGPGSPAIDAGSNMACAAAPVDNFAQNGAIRPIDGDGNGSAVCDIGAVESQGATKLFLQYIQTSGQEKETEP